MLYTTLVFAHRWVDTLAWGYHGGISRPLDLGGSWTNLFIAALAAAWALMGPWGLKSLILHHNPFYIGVLVGALVGFVLHEYAHERAAYRAGCWARFVLHPLGLAITIVSGFLPFALIAPGAVSVACPHWGRGWGSGSGEEDIAAAGVIVNLGLALAALIAAIVSPTINLAAFSEGFGVINAWVAVFNLIPFPPLDGWRLARLNPGKWLALFLAAVALWAMYMML